MSNPATRLITLILLLQRRPNQKAVELANELGVSVRTLHRYIVMLDEMGIPVYTERGPYGGFSLVRGYRMPPLVFTPEEAVAVYLGTSLVQDTWGSLYREAASGVLAKIETTLPDEQRQEIAWARQALLARGVQRIDWEQLGDLLDPLRKAVRSRQRVEILYQSSGRPAPARRELDPYALIHRSGWWYVVGFCNLRRAVRSFRIDRIQALKLLDTNFPPADHFDLQAYLAAEFRSQPEVKSRLRFLPQAAHIARENRAIWETLEEEPDGSVVVTLVTPEPSWAASFALSYGPAVQVLEPPEVRQLVKEWAQATAELYGDEEEDFSAPGSPRPPGYTRR